MPTIDAYVESLGLDGYCVIDGAFSAEWCGRASAADPEGFLLEVIEGS